MSQPFIGEIRYVGFNFAPVDWQVCDGALLPISEYETLFNLIGTTFGGDGQSTFALPDLRGRVAVHQGQGLVLGEQSGAETVTLSTEEIPSHSHSINVASAIGNTPAPGGNVFAASSAGQYAPLAAATGAMGSMVTPAGGTQPHPNIQPYLTLTPIIALFGIFPSQS
jgi:microcystin-dependent protein